MVARIAFEWDRRGERGGGRATVRCYQSYDHQLSREGVDRYAELMKWCLEDGEFEKDLQTCRYRAPFFVGIDVDKGKAVKEYMAGNWLSTNWLIQPGWVR